MLGKLIIILGYTLSQNCTVQPILESRLEKGLSVYELQDKVLVFGRMLPLCLAPKRFEAITDAQAMKLFLVQNDIPESEIYKEETSTNTFGNAFYSREIISEL